MHVPLALLKPGKFCFRELNVGEWQEVVRGDSSSTIPKTAKLSMPDVFNGMSTCLIDALAVLYPRKEFLLGYWIYNLVPGTHIRVGNEHTHSDCNG